MRRYVQSVLSLQAGNTERVEEAHKVFIYEITGVIVLK